MSMPKRMRRTFASRWRELRQYRMSGFAQTFHRRLING